MDPTAPEPRVVPLALRRAHPSAAGAAALLGELARLGADVPAGFAVLPARPPLASIGGAGGAAGAAHARGLPAAARAAIADAYEALCAAEDVPDLAVAVRAGDAEAGRAAACASGPEEVAAAVGRLWGEADAAGRPAPAVLVQRWVPCDASGRLRREGGGRIAVESAWGPPPAPGPCDRFVLDAATLAVAEARVARKGRQAVAAAGAWTTQEVDPERAEAPSLTPEEAARLAALFVQAEARLGAPLEIAFGIEWVGSSRRIRILAAAPVFPARDAWAAAEAPAAPGLPAAPGPPAARHGLPMPAPMAAPAAPWWKGT